MSRNGIITHMVFDLFAKNPLVIVGAGLFLTIVSDTLPEESSNVIRFPNKVKAVP